MAGMSSLGFFVVVVPRGAVLLTNKAGAVRVGDNSFVGLSFNTKA